MPADRPTYAYGVFSHTAQMHFVPSRACFLPSGGPRNTGPVLKLPRTCVRRPLVTRAPVLQLTWYPPWAGGPYVSRWLFSRHSIHGGLGLVFHALVDAGIFHRLPSCFFAHPWPWVTRVPALRLRWYSPWAGAPYVSRCLFSHMLHICTAGSGLYPCSC